MLRRWWRSLGFYWQVYIAMVVSFGGIIMLVEGVAEPLVLQLLVERFRTDHRTSEIILWIVGVLVPTLAIGFIVTHIVTRKMAVMVKLATRLTSGDFSARINSTGNSRDVFNRMAGVFNEMAGSIERLLSHEKRLLADISHELRSPLTRMGIATALLPLKQQTGQLDKAVAVLENELTQMNTLVAVLLEQGRDRLKSQSEYRQLSLSALTKEILDAHSLVADRKDVVFAADIDPDAGVWGHPLRLRMVMDNIFSNAVFYAPQSSTIDIRVWQTNEWVFLIVRDRGPGVPDKHLMDIFQPFFRVDKSRARTSGGVGLGLALARDAAIAIGGDINAENTDPGLQVTVTLPRE